MLLIDLLPQLNKILEENTENLGCSPESAAWCADKLLCSRILKKAGIKTPEIVKEAKNGKKYIIKPRFGCGAEATSLVNGLENTKFENSEFEGNGKFIASEYIEGEHLSVSLIAGPKMLPLTVNRQFIEFDTKKGADFVTKEGKIGKNGKIEVPPKI